MGNIIATEEILDTISDEEIAQATSGKKLIIKGVDHEQSYD